jgi:hypothetical protein
MITLTEGKKNCPPKDLDPKNNICLVQESADGSKHWFYGSNLVTDDGDTYYAQQSAYTGAGSGQGSGTPSPNFFVCSAVLQNPSSADSNGSAEFKNDTFAQFTTPILTGTATAAWAVQAVEATAGSGVGYPKANDLDADNSGKGVDIVTYKFTWTTGQINTGSGNAITGGCIVQTSDVTSSNGSIQSIPSGTKLLTRWNFASPASFHKTSTDTLTLYVNHTMTGV